MRTKNKLIYLVRQIIGQEEATGFYTNVVNNNKLYKVPNYLFKDAPAEYPEIRISPFIEDVEVTAQRRLQCRTNRLTKIRHYKAIFQIDIYATTIQNINQGKTYINPNLSYPLKDSKTGKRKLDNEQVLQIIKEIKNNPKESLASIGRRLNVSPRTISSINCGTTYKQSNENYPIR